MRFIERIRQDEQLRATLLMLGAALLCVGILRLVIYQWLRTHGYFYGIPWDSFSRALISYEWSKNPFFSLSDGYWLPLQFWLVGSAFALIHPWVPTSEILAPVIVNQFFFLGSITVLFFLTLEITRKPLAAFAACLLAGMFAGDVFVSYSALSEPMLIFLMLLASYFFYIMHTGEKEKHPGNAIKAALIVLLATATHYIGWFLAVFFCLYLTPFLFQAVLKKDIKKSIVYLFAVFLCVIVPVIWLYNSYLLFNDPFYPLQTARQAQSAYIGQMGIAERIFVVPREILKNFYPISVPGLIALVVLLFKKPQSLVYSIPMGFVLGWIWLSTGLAFSAPYQEPRYLVFAGWALILLIAIVGYALWNLWLNAGKIIAVIALLIIVALNLQQIVSFKNNFDENVRSVALQIRYWLEENPTSARVILNQDSFAETGVIPLISGHPDQIILVSDEEILAAHTDPRAYLNAKADPWLCITKNKGFADAAKRQGLTVKKRRKLFSDIRPVSQPRTHFSRM
ncbi:MAG: hypothetical protein M5U05_05115 [Anaerolineales bacterium]|nr:hypothetical protein [Anaerolineales bacterium]